MSEPLVNLVPRDEKWQKLVEEDVISRLETCLGKARAGQLSGIAIVMIQPDGGSTTTWSKSMDRMKLIGAMEYLKWRILETVDKES